MIRNQALRSRAENMLSKSRSQIRDMPTEEVEDMFHELQVYHVELEMQNEELRRIQEELMASRQKYSDLYDFAPLGYLTLNREGVISDVNFLASLWLGRPRSELKGKRFDAFVPPEFRDVCYMHLRRVFDTGGRQCCDVELAGNEMLVQLNSQANIPEDGFCCMTMTDVSALRACIRPISDSTQPRKHPD